MRKQEFLDALGTRLSGLPKAELEERIGFYSEMIDDRIEEGLSEEEAVADIGPVAKISEQIIADIPLKAIAKEKIKPKRRLKWWEILCLILGSPIWLSLLIAAFAVILSLYAVLWSLIASVWAVFAAVSASSLACVAMGVLIIIEGEIVSGVGCFGAALLLSGLAVLLFLGSIYGTTGTARLSKIIALGIKKLFIRKEDA
ncbi:MAG: DUF1700 domain-containing protein [Ruminococcaceae bacterium]|nr:DUF1700 domain-containing protein [Oscillospiraceae bacterium]